MPMTTDVSAPPLTATYLLDNEAMALTSVAYAGAAGLTTYREVKEMYPDWPSWFWSNIEQAMISLRRFGLIETILTDMGHYVGRTIRNGSEVLRISEAGQQVLTATWGKGTRCCEFVVRLECVCSERTFCPDHGGVDERIPHQAHH